MTTPKHVFTALLLSSLFFWGAVGNAQTVTNVDLSSWSEFTLDLTGGQNAGNWDLSNSNQTVTQTINADPSFFLNNLNQTNYQIDGSWRVITSSDDDFMGFVFGYQNASNFYLFDWKQNTQDAGIAYGTAEEGFTIRKISAPSVSDLTLRDFWNSTGDTNSTILATNYGSTKGWGNSSTYDFHLDFEPGQFNIIVSQGTTELWNTTVKDNTWTSGEFGFYNFSQEQVQYEGFVQTGGEVIPESSVIGFLSFAGLGGFLFWRRLRKNA